MIYINFLKLRTVTAVPPLTVLLFAGPIHLKREILDDYSIGKLINFAESVILSFEINFYVDTMQISYIC